MIFPFQDVEQQHQSIAAEWSEEFSDGYRTACGLADEQLESGGYPIGFHKWSKSRKYAWFMGWNRASKYLTYSFIC